MIEKRIGGTCCVSLATDTLAAPNGKKRRVECCDIPLKPKPGLTPISCHAVLERSACAPFSKERRMRCINATGLHRKSGQWGTQPSLPVKDGGFPRQLLRRLAYFDGIQGVSLGGKSP